MDDENDDFSADIGDECVGVATSTISVNPTLRHEATSLLEHHLPPHDAILLEGWVAGLERRMSSGKLGSNLDEAAMVIGVTRVFSDDNWAKMTSWLQHQLHGRSST